MIVRIWRGKTTHDTAGDYLQHLAETVLPSLQGIDGYAGIRVLQRNCTNGVEFLVTTHWRSLEAIHAFAGDRQDVAVVHPVARSLLVEFDSLVRHFEIVIDDFSSPASITETVR